MNILQFVEVIRSWVKLITNKDRFCKKGQILQIGAEQDPVYY